MDIQLYNNHPLMQQPVYDKLLLTSAAGNRYITEMNRGLAQHKMGHLACFSGLYNLIKEILNKF